MIFKILNSGGVQYSLTSIINSSKVTTRGKKNIDYNCVLKTIYEFLFYFFYEF